MLQDGHPPLLFASSAVGDGHAVEYVADEVGTAWRRLACSAGQIKAVRGETFAAAGEFELCSWLPFLPHDGEVTVRSGHDVEIAAVAFAPLGVEFVHQTFRVRMSAGVVEHEIGPSCGV